MLLHFGRLGSGQSDRLRSRGRRPDLNRVSMRKIDRVDRDERFVLELTVERLRILLCNGVVSSRSHWVAYRTIISGKNPAGRSTREFG
jgi:hypothetical protein